MSKDVNAQEGFHFFDQTEKRHRVNFRLIHNLIIIPVEINNQKLSFILDSGVSKTILFNISQNDSIGLKDVKKVQLRGLGKGEPVAALISENNIVSIKNIGSSSETIYVILKDNFDLSSKMGITIHGIIGYNILKNFVVKVNYNSKKIDFYNTKKYSLKKCRKCEIFPIEFYRKKPYLEAKVQLDTIGNETTKVKLLIDSGGSDALWLFEGSKENIKTPIRFFNDILGEGLSGTIYGNRSRIPKVTLGSFEIIKPTVSFLDSISSKHARLFTERHGSIGAGILKRFKVWFDYSNRQIMLRKNASLTKEFNYNMSGLEIVYSGKQLVKEKETLAVKDGYEQKLSTNNSVSFITSFSYKFKPTFKIRTVVSASPAEKAGLLKDDILLKINGKPVYEYTIAQITSKFQTRNKSKIKMIIERDGIKMKFEFRLEKKI
ncbi:MULTISPECIES: aspartyl protease family protein [unclassified Polaribacter]|uniref:aspartyl protease family protein n=1 Tax=unclassified Polaribacter TaxID=196858 RepID=UPI0011BDF7A8|nr:MULTISPECIES: aspartyl protease family protein [unclassified Polaribacter]TXD50953.1 PDZ domain-containing protein [Polaribacter sp. IC063]TXD57770.1 PDZ domain-containing protein [Polaribacter sp. IC066]